MSRRPVRWKSRACGALLALYPPDYRKEFGEEMQEVIMDTMMESSSPGFFAGAARLAREVWGLVRGAIREWFRRRDELPGLPSRLPLRGAIGFGIAFLVLCLYNLGFSVMPAALTSGPGRVAGIAALCIAAGLAVATACGLVSRRGFGPVAWSVACIGLGWGLAGGVATLSYVILPVSLTRAGPLPGFARSAAGSALQGFLVGAGLGGAVGGARRILPLAGWGAAAFAAPRIIALTLELLSPSLSAVSRGLMLFGIPVIQGIGNGAVLGWALARTARWPRAAVGSS